MDNSAPEKNVNGKRVATEDAENEGQKLKGFTPTWKDLSEGHFGEVTPLYQIAPFYKKSAMRDQFFGAHRRLLPCPHAVSAHLPCFDTIPVGPQRLSCCALQQG